MSRFTHFLEDFEQKVFYCVKNSVSWTRIIIIIIIIIVRSALLHDMYCILYRNKFASLQICAKRTHLSQNYRVCVRQKSNRIDPQKIHFIKIEIFFSLLNMCISTMCTLIHDNFDCTSLLKCRSLQYFFLAVSQLLTV